MSIKKNIFYFIFYIHFFWGQDYFYTQKFTNPMTISPAWVGKANGVTAAFGFRDMWANIQGTFIQSDLSIDGYFPRPRIAVGAKLNYQQLGTGGFYFVGGEAAVAYPIYIYKKEQLYIISPGISFGAVNSGIRTNKLVFYDQILNGGPSASTIARENKTFLDVNTGLAFLTSYNFGFSLSAFHLNFPNVSFEKLNVAASPIRTSVFAYYNWNLSNLIQSPKSQWKNQWILFMIEWQYQADSHWLDVGMRYRLRSVTMGLSFERLSVGQRTNINPTASLMIAADIKDFSIGYSFSWGIGSKNTVFGGSNEVSFKYYINTHNYDRVEKKKDRLILKKYETIAFPKI